MRKLLLIGLLSAGACTTRTVEVPGPAAAPAPTPALSAPGAPSPRLAVEGFLSAVKAQDLQAMSLVWGDRNGPVRDSRLFPREEMEQREIYLIRCLKHDRYRVLGESQAADNERVIQVELVRGTVTRVTDFYTARGADRWYVRSANMDTVKDLCSTK